jgi:uncharacterized lipoprotein YehR (DUF1307 family)
MNFKYISPLLVVTVLFALTGCGKSEPEKTAAKPVKSEPVVAQQKSGDSLDHQAFERKYADMCVNQELALRKQEHPTSGNVGVADASLADLCACIAKEESKRLTKEEARKFVNENEYPMSLMIKAGQAEEVCSKK